MTAALFARPGDVTKYTSDPLASLALYLTNFRSVGRVVVVYPRSGSIFVDESPTRLDDDEAVI